MLDGRSGRSGRTVVTVALISFAAWTLCYQVALAAGISSGPTLVAATALSVLALVVLFRGPHRSGADLAVESLLPGRRAAIGAVGVTAVATGLALTGLRAPALALGGLAAAIALLALARGPENGSAALSEQGPQADAPVSSTLTGGEDATPSRLLWPIGWVAAVASAYGAMRIARTDGDDAYFVNLSSWIADRGSFPLNDTMISQDVLPPNGAHSPPTHSVEALIGAVARLTHLEAGSITYLAITPALTFLGVIALTWAVQESRIPAAPAALFASVGFLWTTGGTGYSFGSFFAVRLWQGKAMLLSLAIPLLFILGSRLLRTGGWRNHLLFGSAVVAAVGFSNTSAFLVPLLLGAMFVAGLVLRRPAGAVRVLLWAAYPVASGVVSFLMAPASPADAELAAQGFPTVSAAPGNPLMTVPGNDGILVVTIVAIGIGALGLGNRTIRTMTAASILVTAVVLLPPTRDLFDALGLRSVVWRMWWLIPVPLLVGGVVGAVAGRVHRRRALLAVPLALALAFVPLVGGRWVGADTAKTRIVSPTTWKVQRGALTEAQYAAQISAPGETVLLPAAASSALAGLTVELQPVSARVYYLPTYAGDPLAHAGERRALQRFIDKKTPSDARSLDDELDLLDVSTACVRTTRDGAIELLQGAGYSIVGTVRNLTCLRR